MRSATKTIIWAFAAVVAAVTLLVVFLGSREPGLDEGVVVDKYSGRYTDCDSWGCDTDTVWRLLIRDRDDRRATWIDVRRDVYQRYDVGEKFPDDG